MFLVGTIQNLYKTENMVVYNFSSLNQMYPRLNLWPPNNLGAINEYDFDMKYAYYIMSNDNLFFDLMQIVYNLYLGKDVFLLVDDRDTFEDINESILKFIQQRYGYNATFITCIDDFINANETSYNDVGYYNIIADKERLAYIVESQRLAVGGAIGDIYGHIQQN